MKFKVGDIVRLKHVTEEEKVQKYDKYWDGFEKWEGMLATIIREIPQRNAYEIEIHKEIGFKKWQYQEAWLESPFGMNNTNKEKPKRKEETIKLLKYLIKQYENRPEIEDMRLGQLLLNAVFNDAHLYNVEAETLQKRIDTMLDYNAEAKALIKKSIMNDN